MNRMMMMMMMMMMMTMRLVHIFFCNLALLQNRKQYYFIDLRDPPLHPVCPGEQYENSWEMPILLA